MQRALVIVLLILMKDYFGLQLKQLGYDLL